MLSKWNVFKDEMGFSMILKRWIENQAFWVGANNLSQQEGNVYCDVGRLGWYIDPSE